MSYGMKHQRSVDNGVNKSFQSPDTENLHLSVLINLVKIEVFFFKKIFNNITYTIMYTLYNKIILYILLYEINRNYCDKKVNLKKKNFRPNQNQ